MSAADAVADRVYKRGIVAALDRAFGRTPV
jgi:hypothetical protein